MPYIIRQTQTHHTRLVRLVLISAYAVMAAAMIHTGYNSPLIQKQRGYVSRYAEPSKTPADQVPRTDHHP